MASAEALKRQLEALQRQIAVASQTEEVTKPYLDELQESVVRGLNEIVGDTKKTVIAAIGQVSGATVQKCFRSKDPVAPSTLDTIFGIAAGCGHTVKIEFVPVPELQRLVDETEGKEVSEEDSSSDEEPSSGDDFDSFE